jgi:hypothetical protein
VGTWLRVCCIGLLTSVAFNACTMKNVNVPPDELMRQFQGGQPMLDCSMAECGLGWMQNQQKAALLEATGNWQELALFVMRIGFMDDLTYYYLGRAAQELGYMQAAQRYYRIAERLSVTDMACGNRPHNICSGHSFPDELYPHLEVVEARLAAVSAPAAPTERTRTKRLVRRAPPQTPPTATAAPGSSQTRPSGFVEPAPAATPTSAGGFVEPAPTSSDPFAPPPVRR